MESFSSKEQSNSSYSSVENTTENYGNNFLESSNNSYTNSASFNQYDNENKDYFNLPHTYSMQVESNTGVNNLLDNIQPSNISSNQINYFPNIKNKTNNDVDSNSHDNSYYNGNVNKLSSEESHSSFSGKEIKEKIYEGNSLINYNEHSQSLNNRMYDQLNISNLNYNINSNSIEKNNDISPPLQNNFLGQEKLNLSKTVNPGSFRNNITEDQASTSIPNNLNIYDQSINNLNDNRNCTLNNDIFSEENTHQSEIVENQNYDSRVLNKTNDSIVNTGNNRSFNLVDSTKMSNIEHGVMNNHNRNNPFGTTDINFPDINPFTDNDANSTFHSESRNHSNFQANLNQNLHNSKMAEKDIHLRKALNTNQGMIHQNQTFQQQKPIVGNVFNQSIPHNINPPKYYSAENKIYNQHSNNFENTLINPHYANYPQNNEFRQQLQNSRQMNNMFVNQVRNIGENFTHQPSSHQTPINNSRKNNELGYDQSRDPNSLNPRIQHIELEQQRQRQLLSNKQHTKKNFPKGNKKVYPYPNTSQINQQQPVSNDMEMMYNKQVPHFMNPQSNPQQSSQQNMFFTDNKYYEQPYENPNQMEFQSPAMEQNMSKNNQQVHQQQNYYQGMNILGNSHASNLGISQIASDRPSLQHNGQQNVNEHIYGQNVNKNNQHGLELSNMQGFHGSSNLQQQSTNYQSQFQPNNTISSQAYAQPYSNNHNIFNYPQGTVKNDHATQRLEKNKTGNNQFGTYNLSHQNKQPLNYGQQNVDSTIYSRQNMSKNQSNLSNNKNDQTTFLGSNLRHCSSLPNINKQRLSMIQQKNNDKPINGLPYFENPIRYVSTGNVSMNNINENYRDTNGYYSHMINSNSHSNQNIYMNTNNLSPTSRSIQKYVAENQSNSIDINASFGNYMMNNPCNNNLLNNTISGNINKINQNATNTVMNNTNQIQLPEKRKKGRPRKETVNGNNNKKTNQQGGVKNPIGRPKKNPPKEKVVNPLKTPGRRGRKSKAFLEEEARLAAARNLAINDTINETCNNVAINATSTVGEISNVNNLVINNTNLSQGAQNGEKIISTNIIQPHYDKTQNNSENIVQINDPSHENKTTQLPVDQNRNQALPSTENNILPSIEQTKNNSENVAQMNNYSQENIIMQPSSNQDHNQALPSTENNVLPSISQIQNNSENIVQINDPSDENQALPSEENNILPSIDQIQQNCENVVQMNNYSQENIIMQQSLNQDHNQSLPSTENNILSSIEQTQNNSQNVVQMSNYSQENVIMQPFLNQNHNQALTSMENNILSNNDHLNHNQIQNNSENVSQFNISPQEHKTTSFFPNQNHTQVSPNINQFYHDQMLNNSGNENQKNNSLPENNFTQQYSNLNYNSLQREYTINTGTSNDGLYAEKQGPIFENEQNGLIPAIPSSQNDQHNLITQSLENASFNNVRNNYHSSIEEQAFQKNCYSNYPVNYTSDSAVNANGMTRERNSEFEYYQQQNITTSESFEINNRLQIKDKNFMNESNSDSQNIENNQYIQNNFLDNENNYSSSQISSHNSFTSKTYDNLSWSDVESHPDNGCSELPPFYDTELNQRQINDQRNFTFERSNNNAHSMSLNGNQYGGEIQQIANEGINMTNNATEQFNHTSHYRNPNNMSSSGNTFLNGFFDTYKNYQINKPFQNVPNNRAYADNLNYSYQFDRTILNEECNTEDITDDYMSETSDSETIDEDLDYNLRNNNVEKILSDMPRQNFNTKTVRYIEDFSNEINMTVQMEFNSKDLLQGIYINFPKNINKIDVTNRPSMYGLLSLFIRELLNTLSIANTGIININYDSFIIANDNIINNVGRYDENNINSNVNNGKSPLYIDINFWDFDITYDRKKILLPIDNYGFLLNLEEKKNEFYITFSRYPLKQFDRETEKLKTFVEDCLIRNSHLLKPEYFGHGYIDLVRKAIKNFFKRRIFEFFIFCNEDGNPIEKLMKNFIDEEYLGENFFWTNLDRITKNRIEFFITQDRENFTKGTGKLLNFKLCGSYDVISNVPNTLRLRKLGNFRQYCGNLCKIETYNNCNSKDGLKLTNYTCKRSINIKQNILSLLRQNNLPLSDDFNVFEKFSGKRCSPKNLIRVLWNRNISKLYKKNKIANFNWTMYNSNNFVDYNQANALNTLNTLEEQDKSVIISVDLCKKENKEICMKTINISKIEKLAASAFNVKINLKNQPQKFKAYFTKKIAIICKQELTILNRKIKVSELNSFNIGPYIVTKTFKKEKNSLSLQNSDFNISNKNNVSKISHKEKIKHYYNMDNFNVVVANIKLRNNLTDGSISSTEKAKINDAKEQLSVVKCNFQSHKEYDSSECFSIIPELSYVEKTSAAFCEKEVALCKNEIVSNVYGIVQDKNHEKTLFYTNDGEFILSKKPEELNVSHVEEIKHYHNVDNLNIIETNIKLKNNLTDANISSIEKAKVNDAKEHLNVADSYFNFQKQYDSLESSTTIAELKQVRKTNATFYEKEFCLAKDHISLQINGIAKDNHCERTFLNVNNGHFALSKKSEELNILHTEEIKHYNNMDTLNIVETNIQLMNDLTEANISSTTKDKLNGEKQHFSVIDCSFESHKNNDSLECFGTMPELSYVAQTNALFCEKEFNLSKNESASTIHGIVNDKIYEKALFNLNDAHIVLSNKPEEFTVSHTEEIKHQNTTNNLNIIQSNIKLKNHLTSARISCTKESKINDAEENLSVVDWNFESHKNNSSLECSGIIPELSYVDKTCATFCKEKFNLSKNENALSINGVVKEKNYEQTMLNINYSCKQIVKTLNEFSVCHKEKVNNYCIGSPLNVIKTNFSLVNKSMVTNTNSIIPIKGLQSSVFTLNNHNVNFFNNQSNSSTSIVSKHLLSDIKTNLNVIRNNFTIKRSQELQKINFIYKEKKTGLSSTFVIDLQNKYSSKEENKNTVLSLTHDSNFFDECECDEVDEMYVYENPSNFKRRRLSSDIDNFSIINLGFENKYLSYQELFKNEDLKNFKCFFKLLTNFVNDYRIPNITSFDKENLKVLWKGNKNNEIFLQTLISMFKEMFPNFIKNISIDKIIFFVYKFAKIFNLSLHDGKLNFIVPDNFMTLLNDEYGIKSIDFGDCFSNIYEYNNQNYETSSQIQSLIPNNNMMQKNFFYFLKLIQRTVCCEGFQSLVNSDTCGKYYLENNNFSQTSLVLFGSVNKNRKRKHSEIENDVILEIENSSIYEKFKILYDTLCEVEGIDKNAPSTEIFLCKLAEKYIGETSISYKQLLEDFKNSEKNIKQRKIDYNYLKKKYFSNFYEKSNNNKRPIQMFLDALIECGTISKEDKKTNDLSNDDNVSKNKLCKKINLSKYLLDEIKNVNDETANFVNVTLVGRENDDEKCEIIAEVLNLPETITTTLPEQVKGLKKRGRKPGSTNVHKKKLSNNAFIDLYSRYDKNIQSEISKKALLHSQKFTDEKECSVILKQIFNFDANTKQVYNKKKIDPSKILSNIANYNPLLYICATGIQFDELKLFDNHHPLHCQMIEVEGTKCSYKAPNKDALYFHILQFHFHETKKCYWKGCYAKTNFKAISNFAEHIASHIKYKRFSCLICNSSYSRHADLKVHIRRNHSSHYRIKCPLKRCFHYFTTVEASIRHLHVYHFPIKQWVCPVYGCGKIFFDKGGANQHIKLCHHYAFKKISKLLCSSEYKNTAFGTITHRLINHFKGIDDEINEGLFSHKHLYSYDCIDVCVHAKERPIEVSDLTNCILKKDLQQITDFGFKTFVNQLKNYDLYIYIRAVDEIKKHKKHEMLPILNRALNFYIAATERLLHKEDIEVYEQMVIELNKPTCSLKIITLDTSQKRFEIPKIMPDNMPELLKNFILSKSYICPNYLKRVQKLFDDSFGNGKGKTISEYETFKNTLPRFVDYKLPGEFSTCLNLNYDEGLKLYEECTLPLRSRRTLLEGYYWDELAKRNLSFISLMYFKRGILFMTPEIIKALSKTLSAASYKLMIKLKKESGLTEEAEAFYMEQYRKLTEECAATEHDAKIYLNFKNVLKEISENMNDENFYTNGSKFSAENLFAENEFMSSFEAFKESTKISVLEIEKPQNKRKIKKNVGEGTENIIEDYEIDNIENADKEQDKNKSSKILNFSPTDIDISCISTQNDADNDVFDECGVYQNLGYNVQLMCRAKISGIYGIYISEENNSSFEKLALKSMNTPFCCSDIMVPEEYKYETYDTKGSVAYISKQKRIELIDTKVDHSILNDLIILDDEIAKMTNQTNICLKAHVNSNDRRKIKLKNKEGLVIEVELSQLDYFRCRVMDSKENDLIRKTKAGLKTITTVKPKITVMYGVQNWEFIGSNDE